MVLLVAACGAESVSAPALPSPEQRRAGCVEAGIAMHVDGNDVFRAFECPDGTHVLIPEPGLRLPDGLPPFVPPAKRDERSA